MWNSVLMDAFEWLNWRGLVDRLFVYTCFFPHHQTQVQGNKKGKKLQYLKQLQHNYTHLRNLTANLEAILNFHLSWLLSKTFLVKMSTVNQSLNAMWLW